MNRRLSLRHKMVLLPLLTGAAVLLAVGLAMSWFVNAHYARMADQTLERAENNLASGFSARLAALVEGAVQLTRSEELVAIAAFVSTYQNIEAYSPLIFDVEKQKLAADLQRRLALSGHDLVAIYDAQDRLIAAARKRRSDNQEVQFILSYTAAEPTLLENAGQGWVAAGTGEGSIFAPLPKQALTNLAGDRGFFVEATQTLLRSGERKVGTVRLSDRVDVALLSQLTRADQLHVGYLLPGSEMMGNFEEVLPGETYARQNDDHFLRTVPLTLGGSQVLTVILGLGKQAYHDQRNMTLLIVLGVLIVSAALTVPLSVWIADRSVVHPMAMLLEKTEAIKAGSYQNLETDPSNDEIGRLSRAVDTMAKNVWQREWELQEYRDHLEQKVQAEIAKRQEQEQLLIRQSRLAAMGEAMSSIAHHWRQPLNALAANVQDLPDAQSHGEMNPEYLQRTVDNSMRLIAEMSATIDAFRNFFRPDSNRVQFSITRAVERTLTMLSPTFANNHITIATDFKDDPIAEGYPNEFAQVILHLLTNSVDAMMERQSSDRRIRVAISKTSADKARVVICDTAGGIDPRMIGKVFEPYVSTKQKSHGSGVGLYMAKMIVEWNMQGTITAENAQEGACFTIEV